MCVHVLIWNTYIRIPLSVYYCDILWFEVIVIGFAHFTTCPPAFFLLYCRNSKKSKVWVLRTPV